MSTSTTKTFPVEDPATLAVIDHVPDPARARSGVLRRTFELMVRDRDEPGLVSEPAAPFGSVKQSGLGREDAHEGLAAFQEAQYLSVACPD